MADSNLIYITVPTKYEHIYLVMLSAATDYGERALKECNCQCDDKYCTLMECFNLFHSVVGAYTQQQEKLADTIAKYISAKLETIGVKSSVNVILPVNIVLIIDNKGDVIQPVTGIAHSQGDTYLLKQDLSDVYGAGVQQIEGYVITKAVIIDNNIESDVSQYIFDNSYFSMLAESKFDKGVTLKLTIQKV